MSLGSAAWSQIKGIHADTLVKALKKDGFKETYSKSAIRTYRHPDGRKVTVHWHTRKKTYTPRLLKALLKDIGWSEGDTKRLGLIK